MTISSTTNRVSYSGNDVTTVFSFPYLFLDEDDLVVVLRSSAGVETTKTITTHYTVSGEGEQAGGSVTMLTAPATGETLVIYRDPELTQDLDLVDNDPLPVGSLEQRLDKLTMFCQRLSNRMDRSLVQRETDSTVDLQLPLLADRTGQFLAFNSSGEPIGASALDDATPASTFMQTVLDDTTAAAARTTLDAAQKVHSATAETSPANDDEVGIYDTSEGAENRITLTNLLKVINDITADTSPDTAADYLLTYDASATAAKKTLFDNLIGALPARRNHIINGAMDYFQRGTSITSVSASAYFADRFKYIVITTAGVVSLLRSTDVPTMSESGFQGSYSAHVDCTTADSSVAAGDGALIRYTMEGYDYAAIKGRQVTLSFWVKATKTGTYCVSFRNSGSDRSYVAEYTVSTTATWEKKTITLTINPSGGTDDYTTGAGLQIGWALIAGSTYQTAAGSWQTGNYIATSSQVNALDSTSNDFRITQVCLNIGSTAMAFGRVAGSIAGELALCQRYYEKSPAHDVLATATSNYTNCEQFFSSNTTLRNTWTQRVEKRTAPTITLYSPETGTVGKIRNRSSNADESLTADGDGTVRAIMLNGTITDANQYAFHWVADADFA